MSNQRKTMTFTGRMFDFTNPKPEMICIEDIAHALALTNRYGGHTRVPYCVHPDTLVLTANLDWIPASELQMGQALIAFEEFANYRKDKIRTRRKLVPAFVTSVARIQRPCYKMIMENGDDLVSSAEHLWLCCTKKSGNQKWITSRDLFENQENRTRYLPKFLSLWEQRNDRDAGWLAGFFDGEGHISKSCWQLGFAQNPGLTLEAAKARLNLDFGEFQSKSPDSKVFHVLLHGLWADKLKWLGEIKPNRLISNLWKHLHSGKAPTAEARYRVRIKKVLAVGVQEVIAIGTTSHTFFANGYGSHNSVAEHCVRMTWLDIGDPLINLLHDAAEAYIRDIQSPQKQDLEWVLPIKGIYLYKAAEWKILRAIGLALGVKGLEDKAFAEETKIADKIMLTTEVRDLMPPHALKRFELTEIRPAPFTVYYPWDWNVAEYNYLARFTFLIRESKK